MNNEYPVWVGRKAEIDDANEAGVNWFSCSSLGTVCELELWGAIDTNTLREFAANVDLAREQDGIWAAVVDLCVIATNFHGTVDAVRALRRFGEVKQLVVHSFGEARGGGYLLWLAGNDRTCSGLTRLGDLTCTLYGDWSPAGGPLVSLAEHQQTMLELAYEILPKANHKAVADRHVVGEMAEAMGLVDVLWKPHHGAAANILRASHAKQEDT